MIKRVEILKIETFATSFTRLGVFRGGAEEGVCKGFVVVKRRGCFGEPKSLNQCFLITSKSCHGTCD